MCVCVHAACKPLPDSCSQVTETKPNLCNKAEQCWLCPPASGQHPSSRWPPGPQTQFLSPEMLQSPQGLCLLPPLSLPCCYPSEYFNPWGASSTLPPFQTTFPLLSAKSRAELSQALGEPHRGRSLKQEQHPRPVHGGGRGRREASRNYRVRGGDKMIMGEF